MWHFVALLPFIYHFKKTDEALDPVWDRALLVVALLFIARFTVFPLAVQFSARRRSPTYHLLKKPRLFFYGCLYLAIWKAIAFFPSQPKSYYLLLFACLPINTAIIEWSRFSRNPNFRRLAYVFGAAVLLISALSMAELLPALFDFFVFCGWGPFILVYAVLERAEKSKVGFMKPLYPDFPPA